MCELKFNKSKITIYYHLFNQTQIAFYSLAASFSLPLRGSFFSPMHIPPCVIKFIKIY